MAGRGARRLITDRGQGVPLGLCGVGGRGLYAAAQSDPREVLLSPISAFVSSLIHTSVVLGNTTLAQQQQVTVE